MRRFLTLAATTVVLAACSKPAELSADKAWVRLPAVATNPAAAYFTLRGGGADESLVAVSAPFAVRSELHESMMGDHGAMQMKPIDNVAIPAGSMVEFKPGGMHVMLFDVAPTVHAGDTVPLTLSFAGGKTLEVKAQVMGAGETPQ